MKRLLLVEDEPGLVLTLTDRLAREGYTTETVGDGETALARATADAFDLILLDVMLPRLSGFDVLRDLRRIHSHICSVAYPVLDAAGELPALRQNETDLIGISASAHPSTR